MRCNLKLTRRQIDEIISIWRRLVGGRPVYTSAYIAALYGVTGSRVRQIGGPRPGRAWRTKWSWA